MTRYLRKPGSEIVVRCDPDAMPGIARDARFTINAMGLRGRMPAASDAQRVLVVGGSTVEDIALSDGETWCDRLAGLLGRGVWVGNAGRAGMRLAHSLCHVEALLPRLRIGTVVVLCGLNDMLSDCGLHMVPGQADHGAEFGYDDETDEELPGDVARDIEFGALVARLKARRRLVQNWISEAPDVVGALGRYRGTADAIVVTARRYGVRPVFVTQPSLWGHEELADTHFYAGGVGPVEGWFSNDHTPWFTPDLLRGLLGLYNHAIRNVCQVSLVPCTDLAARLPAVSGFFYDDFHFSVSGARAVAGLVADTLVPAPRSIYPMS